MSNQGSRGTTRRAPVRAEHLGILIVAAAVLASGALVRWGNRDESSRSAPPAGVERARLEPPAQPVVAEVAAPSEAVAAEEPAPAEPTVAPEPVTPVLPVEPNQPVETPSDRRTTVRVDSIEPAEGEGRPVIQTEGTLRGTWKGPLREIFRNSVSDALPETHFSELRGPNIVVLPDVDRHGDRSGRQIPFDNERWWPSPPAVVDYGGGCCSSVSAQPVYYGSSYPSAPSPFFTPAPPAFSPPYFYPTPPAHVGFPVHAGGRSGKRGRG